MKIQHLEAGYSATSLRLDNVDLALPTLTTRLDEVENSRTVSDASSLTASGTKNSSTSLSVADRTEIIKGVTSSLTALFTQPSVPQPTPLSDGSTTHETTFKQSIIQEITTMLKTELDMNMSLSQYRSALASDVIRLMRTDPIAVHITDAVIVNFKRDVLNELREFVTRDCIDNSTLERHRLSMQYDLRAELQKDYLGKQELPIVIASVKEQLRNDLLKEIKAQHQPVSKDEIVNHARKYEDIIRQKREELRQKRGVLDSVNSNPNIIGNIPISSTNSQGPV
jgi:hypothetical protein